MEVEHLFDAHDGQQRLHYSAARFRICVMGRRWGKTTACVFEIYSRASDISGIYWWVAPTYRLARIGRDLFFKFVYPGFIKAVSKTEGWVELQNGSRIFFLSAHHPEMLVGEGVDGLVVDEAARISRIAWEQSLRPALTDTKGWALFASTPLGRNWFHELFLRGMDPLRRDYESFRFPTEENPYIDSAEVEEARRTLPDRIFRQEYLAEFIDETTAVFRNIHGCVQVTPPTKRSRNELCIMGVDLARHHDYTVIVVMNGNGEVLHFDRFSGLEWGAQKARITGIAGRFNAEALVDATGIGDPIVDDLKNLIKVKPFVFTSQTKRKLIWHLILGIEEGKISYPNIPELISELEAYTYEISQAGNVTYGAPTGGYDDCVTALALAWWQCRHSFQRTYWRAARYH